MSMDDDVRKFFGLPPYDEPSNISRADGYFANDFKARYGISVYAARAAQVQQEQDRMRPRLEEAPVKKPERESQRITLRDQFAGQVMAGMVASEPWNDLAGDDVLANRAYALADAMLEARKRKDPKP